MTDKLDPWLLRLPANLNTLFYQDGSVQWTFALFDVLALTLVLLLNWRLMRLFHVFSSSSVLLVHQRAGMVLHVVLALMQFAYIGLWPRQYHRHRHWIVLCNRLGRIMILLCAWSLTTPTKALQQYQHFLMATAGTLPVSSSRCIFGQHHAGPSISNSSSMLPADAAAAQQQFDNSTDTGAGTWDQQLLKSVMWGPVVYVLSANFVVEFRVALLLQFLTLAVSVGLDLRRICAIVCYRPQLLPSAVVACRSLGQFAHVVSQLLAWDMPGSSSNLVATSEAICQDPLIALLLLKLLAHLLVLFLLPCGLVYSLEWSLKSKFLQNQMTNRPAEATMDAAMDATIYLQGQERGQIVPRLSTMQQQRQRRWQQSVWLRQPAAAHSISSNMRQPHEPSGHTLQLSEAYFCQGRLCSAAMIVVLVLTSVLVCWYVCEVGLILVLRGQRRLVCDAGGWLTVIEVQQVDQ